jgi:tyrosyl-tRNA synthetase
VDYGDAQILETMTGQLRERLEESRRSGRPLTVYVGVDPTGTDLTLGHTVPLRKLRQFQDLGHHGIFVIGTMTAMVGDPSEHSAVRRRLTADEVEANAATYSEQALKVLDRERTEIRRNGDWLGRLDFAQLLDLASNFTVQQFLQRDNFAKRFKQQDAIWLHEFFYALMQAYDALELQTDVQIGGTEQLFNLMAGRKLQEAAGQRPQIPVTLPILVGTDGRLRMSTTRGNYVGIAEAPEEQFGKTMSLPDEATDNWWDLVTSLHPDEINSIREAVAGGSLHPMEAKKKLAREIVRLFHGPDAAASAQDYFERTVQSGDTPEAHEMPTAAIEAPIGLLDVMSANGLASTKSEARRLVQQSGVRIDGEVVSDPTLILEPGRDRVLQVGKRRFLRLT